MMLFSIYGETLMVNTLQRAIYYCTGYANGYQDGWNNKNNGNNYNSGTQQEQLAQTSMYKMQLKCNENAADLHLLSIRPYSSILNI